MEMIKNIQGTFRKAIGNLTEPPSHCPICGDEWKYAPSIPSNIYKHQETIECRNGHRFTVRRLYKLPYLDTVTVRAE